MFKRLAGLVLLRRLVRDLAGLRADLATHNQLLARLVDHLCPAPPLTDRDLLAADAVADTGLSFLDPVESSLALDYIARTQADTGHTPDEEEILVYLADEKTHDLHLRLQQRETDLARLTRARVEGR